MYCVESPESWFEDFGIGEMVNGSAKIQLDSDFIMLIENNSYHVFLTPEGDSKGLFISKKLLLALKFKNNKEEILASVLVIVWLLSVKT